MFRKSAILVTTLFVIALAIIGCGGGGGGTTNPTGPALTPGATANLSGTVLYDSNPIPFASVYLLKSEKAHTIGMAQLPALKGSLVSQQIIGDGAYSTTTDAVGTYNFVDIPVGQYTLIAQRDETHQFVQTGVLLGQVTTLNPQLTPTGTITGNVSITSGSTSQGVAGVFVYIEGTSYIAVTDTAGNFSIDNVPSNTLTNGTAYTLLISSDEGSASPVTGLTVSPGATYDAGTISLTPTPATSYVLLNGSLVAGSNVTAAELAEQFVIITHQNSGTIFGTHTDSSGNYTFRVTETGTYLVLCTEGDYSFSPDPLTIEVTSLTNSSLTLSQITVDAEQAQEIGSIIGSVNLAGSPLAGAVIHASGTSLVGVSNAEGNFVIEKVPANTSANPYTIEISSNRGFASAKTGIVVNAGQAADVGAFTIVPPTSNYKTITGQLNAIAPITTAMLENRLVQLTAPDGKVTAAYSDNTGAFSFITMQTGDHKATVIDASLEFSPRTQIINVTVLDNGSQALVPIDASEAFPQPEVGMISGTVTTMGPPVTGAPGAIVSVNGTSLLGMTDSSGNYVIERVPVNVTPYTVEVSSSHGTAAPSTGIMVTANQTTTVNFSLTEPPVEPKYQIVGSITKDIKIKPEVDESGVSIKLTPEAGTDPLYTFSKADGSFNFLVAPGTYTLTVEGVYELNPNTPIELQVTGPYTFASILHVRPGQIVPSIVEGTVTWPAVAGWNFTEGEVILESPTFVQRHIVSNVSPAPFRFENVPPGAYTLKTNPLRNGYDGSLAISVTEGIDLTGQSLNTTFIAPLITSVATDGYIIHAVGQQFATTATMQGYVNDKPLPTIDVSPNLWDATNCYFNGGGLPPGDYAIQLIKDVAGVGPLAGNKKVFTRGLLPPLSGSFVASSTDTTITYSWQNEPYVNAVDVRLLLGGTEVRTPQRITGSRITYDNLLPGTEYTIEVSSTYPNVPNSDPTPFNAFTKTNGINSITSETFTGAGIATGTIFGFEVVGNYAYVGFDNSGPITIQSFDLTTNSLASTSTVITTNSNHAVRSLAANSTGVFLTYDDSTNGASIAVFNTTLEASPVIQTFVTAFGLTNAPNMATVRSLNDQIYIVLTEEGDIPQVRLFETDTELNPVQVATSMTTASNTSGKTADISYDRVTNTIYLTHIPMFGYADIISYKDMNLSNPITVGRFVLLEASMNYIYGFAAENDQIFISTNDTMDNGIGQKMDARTGRTVEVPLINPTNFGFDIKHQMWALNINGMSAYFFQLDNALSIQKSLETFNTSYLSKYLPAIKSDNASANMYMLHFNAANELAVYKYNSNF